MKIREIGGDTPSATRRMGTRRSAGPSFDVTRAAPSRDTAGVDECDGGGIFARRTKSAGKLLGYSHTQLQEVLQPMENNAKMMFRMADNYRKTATPLTAWGRQSRNAAFDDVAQHHAELMKILDDQTRQCASSTRYGIETLHKMADAEKNVKERENRVTMLKDKRAKLLKTLQKEHMGLFRRRSEGDTIRMRQQYEQVTMDIESEEARLNEEKKECEVIKMIRYREGMMAIAHAHMRYAARTAAIFGAVKEITEVVPHLTTEDVMTINYEGADNTKNIVRRLKRELNDSIALTQTAQLLGSCRVSSEPRRGYAGISPRDLVDRTPPPPYTPSAPFESELPQPGSLTSSASSSSTSSSSSQSPPSTSIFISSTVTPVTRSTRLYPKLPPNPYREVSVRRQLHS